ncbi:sugar ABC transporter substrate-binding protein [Streptosporangium sp. NPDC087985]|uniref:sugar ABC transporter substrate-binding protein n=1 Tax=Streptosporangium sp. NPDC087985 TaxID=3366196 RepID=UPI00380F7696
MRSAILESTPRASSNLPASGAAVRCRRTFAAFSALVVLGLGGCDAAGGQASGPAAQAAPPSAAPSVDPFRAEGFTIGIANFSLASPYLTALSESMEARAAEVGVATVSRDAGGDAAKLAADVTDLLAEGVDGILVSTDDLVNAPALSLAMQDSRVSLVFVGRALDSGAYNAAIGPDYPNVGWDSCDYLGSALGGRGKLALIEGGPTGHPIGRQLSEGFENCLKQTYPEMTVVKGAELGDWTAAGGERVMKAVLAEHTDIVAVYCHNDAMCLGAQKAAADAGRTDQLIFVGTGGTAEAFQAIMDGTNFNATSLIDPAEIGEQGVNVMVTIFKREDLVRHSFVPSPLIRPENATEYYDAVSHG